MSTARKRLFFAAALDDAARTRARDVAESLAAYEGNAVRWVAPENYHVTLRFLGDTEVDAIPNLVASVRRESAARKAFSARLGALLLFPEARRARAVALAVESDGALEDLAARVERGVCEAGVAPRERAFRPHLTLGRTRRGRRYRPAPHRAATADGVAFSVDAAWLFSSELSSEGARYHALERIALEPRTHPH